MTGFKLPQNLIFNRGLIRNPDAFAKKCGCASWLYLNGTEFDSMEGGMSYDLVLTAVPYSVNVISDPPRVLDLKLAQRHVEALDNLPRPTLISCRMGPRASAVAYMYAGLKQGAAPEDVLATADKDSAPFCRFPEYKEWVKTSIEALGDNTI